MSAPPVELTGWSRRKWWTVIGLIFLLHLGLVFWLSPHSPAMNKPPSVKSPNLVMLPPRAAEKLDLMDPTALIWPSPTGFSRWLTNFPVMDYAQADWPGTNFTLSNRVERLGAKLSELVEQRLAQPYEVAEVSAPQPEIFKNFAQAELMPTNSSLKIEGALAGRRLLAPLKLEPVASPEVLSNTVVEILVDGDGRFSSLVPSRWEKEPGRTKEADAAQKEADAKALALAKSLRFAPLRGNAPGAGTNGLTGGRLTFQWLTVPPPGTNGLSVEH